MFFVFYEAGLSIWITKAKAIRHEAELIMSFGTAAFAASTVLSMIDPSLSSLTNK